MSDHAHHELRQDEAVAQAIPGAWLPTEDPSGEPHELLIYYVGHLPVAYHWRRREPTNNGQ